MKKLAIVAAIATTAAVAAPFNGFSVGANVGASFNKNKLNTSQTLATGRTGSAVSQTYNSSTFIGSLFVGYTKSFNNVFAGLDLGLGFEGKKTNSYTESGTQQGSFTYKPGIAFQASPRIGYKFNDTMGAYFKLGMDWAKTEVKWDVNGNLPAAQRNAIPSYKVKRTVFSVSPTLGLEKAFNNVSVRGEVGYKMSGKKTYSQGDQWKRNAVVMTIGASYNF